MVLVFRKIVRLRYQDGSVRLRYQDGSVRLRYQDGSVMEEHLNTFQGLINHTTSLEIRLANEVLALLLLGSLPDSWETLIVTLGNAGPEWKHLSLETVKNSLF